MPYNENINKRLNSFNYFTPGQWIKTLKALNTYSVYYGACDNPGDVELNMLEYFMSNVSKLTLSQLYDKELPIPFANIKFKGNKNHGLKNQRL